MLAQRLRKVLNVSLHNQRKTRAVTSLVLVCLCVEKVLSSLPSNSQSGLSRLVTARRNRINHVRVMVTSLRGASHTKQSEDIRPRLASNLHSFLVLRSPFFCRHMTRTEPAQGLSRRVMRILRGSHRHKDVCTRHQNHTPVTVAISVFSSVKNGFRRRTERECSYRWDL